MPCRESTRLCYLSAPSNAEWLIGEADDQTPVGDVRECTRGRSLLQTTPVMIQLSDWLSLIRNGRIAGASKMSARPFGRVRSD